jgi:WxcM-like, C-terminal
MTIVPTTPTSAIEPESSLARIENVLTINLQTCSDPDRGNLTIVQGCNHVPFPIARIFYIYNVPHGCARGAHAHRVTSQVFIAISGQFSLDVSDGRRTKTYQMNEPREAILAPPLIWVRVYDFTSDAVCLVLTSASYDPADYIRDWDAYLAAVGGLVR